MDNVNKKVLTTLKITSQTPFKSGRDGRLFFMANYVTIYEEYKHKFFQLPKVFFTSDRYKDMSNNAKVAWSILRDRSSLSRKNNWFDKDTGRIYFVFKNKELMKLLNIKSETTLVKIKKELEKASLIEQEQIGYNRPNKIYLIYPVIEEDDIYKIDEFESYKLKDEKEPQSQGGQGTSKNGVPKNEVPYPQKMESSNTEFSNTELKDLDTIDTEDTNLDFSENNYDINSFTEKERLQKKEEYMSKAFYENEEYIPKELSNMLSVFSRTPDEAKKYYDIILKAKNNVAKETEEIIWLEHEPPELINELVNTVARAIRKIEKEGNITNEDGYIYKAVYTLLTKEITSRQRQKWLQEAAENKSIYFYDWLNDG